MCHPPITASVNWLSSIVSYLWIVQSCCHHSLLHWWQSLEARKAVARMHAECVTEPSLGWRFLFWFSFWNFEIRSGRNIHTSVLGGKGLGIRMLGFWRCRLQVQWDSIVLVHIVSPDKYVDRRPDCRFLYENKLVVVVANRMDGLVPCRNHYYYLYQNITDRGT